MHVINKISFLFFLIRLILHVLQFNMLKQTYMYLWPDSETIYIVHNKYCHTYISLPFFFNYFDKWDLSNVAVQLRLMLKNLHC